MMKAKPIAYWTATALLALELLVGSLWDLSHFRVAVEILTRLGYPLYMLTILGIWKLLAVPALLMPGYLRLKEWTYAGIFFLTTGAIASHAACVDVKGLISPAVLLLLTIASWALHRSGQTVVPSAAEARV
jgi:hypothetical protein